MPYADFQPSAESSRVNRQILDNVDFGGSMMERAARHASLLQDIEHRQQRFVQDSLLSDQKIQENRLILARLQGEQAVNAARNRTEVALADERYTRLQTNLTKLGQAAAELPTWRRRVEEAEDAVEMQSIAAEFHSQFGGLLQDPAVAQQYAGIEGPFAALVQTKVTAYRARVQNAVESFPLITDTTDLATLSQMKQAPLFSVAMRDRGFADAYRRAEAKRLAQARQAMAPHRTPAPTPAPAPILRPPFVQTPPAAAAPLQTPPASTPQASVAPADAAQPPPSPAPVVPPGSALPPPLPRHLASQVAQLQQSDRDLRDYTQQSAAMEPDQLSLPFRDLPDDDAGVQLWERGLRSTLPYLRSGALAAPGVLTEADVQGYLRDARSLPPRERAGRWAEVLQGALTRQRTRVRAQLQKEGFPADRFTSLQPRASASGNALRDLFPE